MRFVSLSIVAFLTFFCFLSKAQQITNIITNKTGLGVSNIIYTSSFSNDVGISMGHAGSMYLGNGVILPDDTASILVKTDTNFLPNYFKRLGKRTLAPTPQGTSSGGMGCIQVSPLNNIYCRGSVRSQYIVADSLLTAHNNGSEYVPTSFRAYFDMFGNLQWLKKNNYSIGTSSALFTLFDEVGNIYEFGSFDLSVSIDSQGIASASRNIYIAKFRQDGHLIWLKKLANNSAGNYAYLGGQAPIFNPEDGHIYLSGEFGGTCVLGGIVLQSTGVPAAFRRDGFIAKIDTSGNVVAATSVKYYSNGPSTPAPYIGIAPGGVLYAQLQTGSRRIGLDTVFIDVGSDTISPFLINARRVSAMARLRTSDLSLVWFKHSIQKKSYTDELVFRYGGSHGNGNVLNNGNFFISGRHRGNVVFIDTLPSQTHFTSFFMEIDSSGNALYMPRSCDTSTVSTNFSIDYIDRLRNTVYLRGELGSPANSLDSCEFGGYMFNSSHKAGFIAQWKQGLSTSLPSKAAQEQLQFGLYPNPAKEEVNIQLTTQNHPQPLLKKGGELRGRIFNLQGKQLQTFTLQGEQTTISLRGLPSGMYIIQLQTEQGSVSKKLVKE